MICYHTLIQNLVSAVLLTPHKFVWLSCFYDWLQEIKKYNWSKQDDIRRACGMHIWEVKSLQGTGEKTEEKDTTWKMYA
jgi:hypothetical protein